jgi:splicing suppressor protein 51
LARVVHGVIYGDGKMPMQLRMLAEMVYGYGTTGQDGSGVRKLMMGMEDGGSGNMLSLLSMR